MPCRLVAFDPVHVEQYSPGSWEIPYFDRDVLRASSEGWGQNAVTALDGDEVLGVCVWFINGNTARVSMLLTDKIREQPFFLHRSVLNGISALETSGIKTIFVSCLRTHTRSMKWLKRMGFKDTGEDKEFMGMTLMEFVR